MYLNPHQMQKSNDDNEVGAGSESRRRAQLHAGIAMGLGILGEYVSNCETTQNCEGAG
jgi:hypothetical protein